MENENVLEINIDLINFEDRKDLKGFMKIYLFQNHIRFFHDYTCTYKKYETGLWEEGKRIYLDALYRKEDIHSLEICTWLRNCDDKTVLKVELAILGVSTDPGPMFISLGKAIAFRNTMNAWLGWVNGL